MYCSVCALPAQGVCGRCLDEGAPFNPPCVFCRQTTFFEDRVKMPCDEIAHIDCAKVVDVIGCCPGACWENDPRQGAMMHENKGLVFKAFLHATEVTKPKVTPDEILAMELGELISKLPYLFSDAADPTLSIEDIRDMEADQMFFTLYCVYLNGIGVAKDAKKSKYFFNKALEENDPDAMFVKADRKSDFLLMQKAANLGHAKAIRSVVNYYMGKSQNDLALKYVQKGKDPMCKTMMALTAYEAGSPDAETMLRKARHFYTTETMYFKATCNLASIYSKRGDYHQVVPLLTMLHKQTDETFLLLGVAHAGIGNYEKAQEMLLSSETPEASVFIAKLMRAKAVDGNEDAVTRWMTKALKGGHAEAAFYFLTKGDLPAPEEKKLVRILAQCRSKPLLLQFAKDFKDMKQMKFFKLCRDLIKALG
jgi:TPR repeat protein